MKTVAGLDVHKDSVYLCILRENGEKIERVYGVLTPQLDSMRDFMAENKVSEVAMESTSVYWILLVSDKTQKSAYLLGSTADFRRLSLLFVQDKPPPLRFTKVREEKLRPFQEG